MYTHQSPHERKRLQWQQQSLVGGVAIWGRFRLTAANLWTSNWTNEASPCTTVESPLRWLWAVGKFGTAAMSPMPTILRCLETISLPAKHKPNDHGRIAATDYVPSYCHTSVGSDAYGWPAWSSGQRVSKCGERVEQFSVRESTAV